MAKKWNECRMTLHKGVHKSKALRVQRKQRRGFPDSLASSLQAHESSRDANGVKMMDGIISVFKKFGNSNNGVEINLGVRG